MLLNFSINPFTTKSAKFKTEEQIFIFILQIVKNKQHYLKVKKLETPCTAQ